MSVKQETLPLSTAGAAPHRKVAVAAFVGTLVEYYDYYIYGTAAALIFPRLFFPGDDPTLSLLASFATFGVGFLARPIGGAVAGHFGDRIGRKAILVFTLLLMGVSTVSIGLLPTFETAGYLAPLLLVLLRLAQGFAAGGEWGGAAVMLVETAPPSRRGFWGAIPQAALSAGLILASTVFFLVSLLPDAQFLQWGWRIPFLGSVVIIVIGLIIRSRIEDPRTFSIAKEEAGAHKVPVAVLFKNSWRTVVLAIGSSGTLMVGGFIANTFVVSYASNNLGLESSDILTGVSIAAGVSIVTWPLAGYASDRWGRKPMLITGTALTGLLTFPFFWLVDSGSLPLLWIALAGMYGIAIGFTAGTVPAFFSELYDTRVRYTGVSVSYQILALLFGGFTPFIATWLVSVGGGEATLVAIYLVAISLLGVVCSVFIPETRGRRLDAARERA